MLLEGKEVPYFHLQGALVCHMGHLCVPTSECANMIWEGHYYRLAGHFGIYKIVAVLQKYFYLRKLQKDIRKYIRSYTTYTISKSTIKKQGPYTPLPTPSRPLESISMDYMSFLPSTEHGNDCMFMVINKFFKMAILAVCKKSITSEEISKIFFE